MPTENTKIIVGMNEKYLFDVTYINYLITWLSFLLYSSPFGKCDRLRTVCCENVLLLLSSSLD